MRLEIEVGAIGNALKFSPLAPCETESILDIHRSLGVVTQFFFWMLESAHVLRVQTQIHVPIPTLIKPVIVPFFICSRLNKEFHFHLLELTGTEYEITRGDFIAETFTRLPNAKWWLLASGRHDIEVIHENTLGGFRSQIMHGACIFNRSD